MGRFGVKSEFLYQNSFCFWLAKLSSVMQEQFNGVVREYDITWSQWLLINHLRQRVNSTPAQASDAIGVDRSAITRLADRLEAKKLVMRMREGLDRRSVSLYLTKQGLDLCEQVDTAAKQHQEKFLESLHSSEQRMLKQALQKMLRSGGVESHEDWRFG